MDKEKTCSNCKYYKKLNADEGECRSLSPHLRGGEKKKDIFPMVSFDSWCGRWSGEKQKEKTMKEKVK